MGEFINFISGISEEMLPIGKIQGILANTPFVLKSASNLAKTAELFDKSQAKYKMLDSGGYQLFLISKKNLEIPDPSLRTEIIMNAAKPIYSKCSFNLVSDHVATAVEAIKPDFVISPDFPIPKPKNPDKLRFSFLNSIGYNLYSAWQLSLLLEQLESNVKLIIPIQAYSLDEVELYLIHLKKFKFDGFSFPSRVMTLQRMAAFFIKTHLAGVRQVHILGTGRFSHIAFASYFARHFFDFTSIDSTDLSKFSLVNSYLMPYTLKALNLRMRSNEDLTQPITCSCPWCSYEHSFSAIQNMQKDGKRAFIVNHNHFVMEQLMADAYEHAGTVSELRNFLVEKIPRGTELGEVFRVLSLVEAVRPLLGNPELVSAFYNKLGFQLDAC